MDEKLGKFIDDFAQLVQLAQSGQHRVQAGTQLLTTLTDHLGHRPNRCPWWWRRFRRTGSWTRTS